MTPQPQNAILPRPRFRAPVRRTATSVMAGMLGRPSRDVFTSLLNGVPPNKIAEIPVKWSSKGGKKAGKRPADSSWGEGRSKPQRRLSMSHDSVHDIPGFHKHGCEITPIVGSSSKPRGPRHNDSSFWPLYIPTTAQPSFNYLDSPTPEPESRSPTPAPSEGSSATHASRPYTPEDSVATFRVSASPFTGRVNTGGERLVLSPGTSVKKKTPKIRKETRKGWKGWVEAPEDELSTDRLIELDNPQVFGRRTRSGKNLDL